MCMCVRAWGGMNSYLHVQVGLTLVTHFGMGMVIFTSSTWNRNRDSINQITQVNWNGTNILPIVCFGPSLILNLPVPSAKFNVNCGVTYTGRATILWRET